MIDKIILKERLVNGLYAQAVCDAVGDPFEFNNVDDPKSVSKYAKDAIRLKITDDTQMALFGFEGLERATRMSGYITDNLRTSVTSAYIDWFYTQDEVPYTRRTRSTPCLLDFESLHVQRAPGNTCMSACYNLSRGDKVANDSMGCGSVMRLLPFAYFANDLTLMTNLAIQSALITHKHAENADAARAYCIAANNCLHLGITGKNWKGAFKHISDLGEGWTALECVLMAIYAVDNASTFDELLEISIAHEGDSDSVAAVAGSLWGLAGRDVPPEYIDKLVELDAIKYTIDNYILSLP